MNRQKNASVSRRRAAASLAAVFIGAAAPPVARRAEAQIDHQDFKSLPPCKKQILMEGWEVIAFVGVHGARRTTPSSATFGYGVGLESEEEAALEVGAALKQRLLDPETAILAAAAVAYEVRAGGEKKRFQTDLQTVLSQEELRFRQEDYDNPDNARPDWTAWLFAAAERGDTLEVALLAGPDAAEVGVETIPTDGFKAAFAKSRELSDLLLDQNRLLLCDRQKKVVCSAMNRAYGFGEFRNAVWLRYSQRLTPEHERGYHALALPMIAYAYGEGSRAARPLRHGLRRILEHMARERTADLWAEMRGGRRRRLGRTYRAVLEPLCWAVGRMLRR